MSYRLGVDVGGTFTDLVLVAPDGAALTRKVLSSTGNYAEAIVQGVRELAAAADGANTSDSDVAAKIQVPSMKIRLRPLRSAIFPRGTRNMAATSR